MILSVIICSHNPREDYLRRTLAALRHQTLPQEQWELLLIDNASSNPLTGNWELSWHQRARHIREEVLGLAAARVRGIREADGRILVFVDDDNLLEVDYLTRVLEIANEFPFIGVWGGAIHPEFDVDPPEWFDRCKLGYACVEVLEDRWSNLKFEYATVPAGAGMCVRREIADQYAARVTSHPIRLLLGRKGESLSSGEDTDLALTACDNGLGTGQFSRLKLTHLIPSRRLTLDYLERLTEGITFSSVIAESIRGKMPDRQPVSPIRAVFGRLRRRLFWNPVERTTFEAAMRGRNRAVALLREQDTEGHQ